MKNLILYCSLAFFLLLSGCRVIEYTSPEGRQLKVTNFGFDTKIGHLDIRTPEGGSAIIDNYDENDQAAWNTLGKAIDKIPTTVPVPIP